MLLLSLKDFLSEAFLGIIMVLDIAIYNLVNSAYKIFMAIASARLLSSDVYYDIASRIYIIIGVLMLFVLSYAILKAIVDPDQATKGDLGPNMVKRVVIAVIGLAITPVLFNVLYQAQGLFLEQDVIGKVFFRIQNTENVSGTIGNTSYSGNPDEQIKNIGGAVAATSIWSAFFRPAEGYDASIIEADPDELLDNVIGSSILCGLGIAATIALGIATGVVAALLTGGATVALCVSAFVADDAYQDATAISDEPITLSEAYAVAAGGGGFDVFMLFIDNYVEEGEVVYSWGISTLCGAFALYAFASFSIDMGVRAAKLAYYQIIAPVPLVMQVLPKYKDTFSKYIKNVVSTFLEVFIRISVVYIVVYIICHLQDLFSSSGALWGNVSLNFGEKALALAFLILGLVIFAKSAPDIICQSLNIEKGSMKLGIGKKLGDGGYYSAKDIAKTGTRQALARGRAAWNDDKNKGKLGKAMSAVGAGISGFGIGVGNNAYDQFLRPGHKPSMNNADIRDHQSRLDLKLDDKYNDAQKNKKKLAAAKSARDAAKEAYDLALAGNDPAEIAKARQAFQDAQEAYLKATTLGRKTEEIAKKFDAWTTISVSVKAEEDFMKFGNALDSLKGQLREEAYKKDAAARRLHDAYNNLKSEPINEYASGWDEQSANAELRRRRAMLQSYSDRLGDLRRQMISTDVTAPEYDRLKAQYEAEEANLRLLGQQNGWDFEIAGDGSIIEKNLLSDIKVDINQARIDRDKQLEGLRMAMEAAADEFVRQKATDVTSNTYRDISKFLSENASYIIENKDLEISLNGIDAPSEKLSKVLTDAFGSAALQGKFDISDVSLKQAYDKSSVKVELSSSIDVGGDSYSQVVYEKEGDKFVPYAVKNDSNGNEVKRTKVVGNSQFEETAAVSFFDKLAEKISTSSNIKKASAGTAVTNAADIGKNSATYVRNNDYADHIARQQRVEDAKNGRK